MKSLFLVLTALLILSASRSSSAASDAIAQGNVIDLLVMELQPFKRAKVFLVQGAIDADLIIAEEVSPQRYKRVVHNKDFVWHGTMAGQEASLEVNPSGSLEVKSHNESIGRTRWSQTVTIAYRGGKFVVAGFTYDSRDTIKSDQDYSCDVNLLTGNAVVNGVTTQHPARIVNVQDWVNQTPPVECGTIP